MLQEFVTCGDCECPNCLRNHSCPKTDVMENPCIDCDGTPPYAPWDIEDNQLGDFGCDEKSPCHEVKKPSELFY